MWLLSTGVGREWLRGVLSTSQPGHFHGRIQKAQMKPTSVCLESKSQASSVEGVQGAQPVWPLSLHCIPFQIFPLVTTEDAAREAGWVLSPCLRLPSFPWFLTLWVRTFQHQIHCRKLAEAEAMGFLPVLCPCEG